MKTNWFTLTSICLLTVGFLALSLPKSPERYEDLTQELLPKTVTVFVNKVIVSTTTQELVAARTLGSGVIVSSMGHVLSCSHLFYGEEVFSIVVETNDGYVYFADLIKLDHAVDLSLLKFEEKDTPFAVLADPRKVRAGQEVIAIGSPLGLIGTVTTGIISAVSRDAPRYDMIQMSAPINPGNSGGPLFNLKGEVVGINVAILTRTGGWMGIGMSVSASEINKFLAGVDGIKRGW